MNPIIDDSMDDPEEKGVPKLTDRSKDGILSYFEELIDSSLVLTGQHCGDGPDQVISYYNDYVAELNTETGKTVGLLGGDLGWYISDTYPVDKLIEHWNDGGLVTLSWHADNPFEDGFDVYTNSVDDRTIIDFQSLLANAPTSEAKTNYRSELDNVAKALQKLRDAGVIVIWRPLHEMNGDFFWWGIDEYNNNQQSNIEDYQALWIDMYETLTETYDLDNLIWVYSAIPTLNWTAVSTDYYPGNGFVDLVGIDYYGENIDFPDFDKLKALGKTIVMSEAGPIGEAYGNWDEMELVNELKGKAAYFLQWHSWTDAKVAIIDNQNVNEMMNSDAAVTLDEM